MSYPTIFANLASGNQPLALFDAMFAQVANMVAIPCVASGTNAITLTPLTGAPTIPAYVLLQPLRFKAVATSNGLVTLAFTGLSFLPAYKSDRATQIGPNDLILNQEYVIVFDPTLNAGNGGFFLENAVVAAITQSVGGSYANLKIRNNALNPDTQVDVSFDECVMVSVGGLAVRAPASAFTINTGVNNVVNGLDVGVLAANTWYAVFAISNGSTTGGLMSTSFTNPTLPSGYIYKKRLGAVITDLGAGQSSAVTISNASPGIVTWTGSNLPVQCPISFTPGGGTLPAQISSGVQYYVLNPTANAFNVSAAPLGPGINTTGGSGTVNAAVPGPRIKRSAQFGNKAVYTVAPSSSVSQLPVVVAGPAGTYAANLPTWASASLLNFVPPSAAQVDLIASTNYFAQTAGQLQVAPTGNYGGYQNSIGNVPSWDSGGVAPTFHPTWHIGLLSLEGGQSVAWAATTAGCTLTCYGWVDNL